MLKVVRELGLAPGDQLRVDTDGDQIVLSHEESLAQRRMRAIREVAGSMPDTYEAGYLERRRDEWRQS